MLYICTSTKNTYIRAWIRFLRWCEVFLRFGHGSASVLTLSQETATCQERWNCKTYNARYQQFSAVNRTQIYAELKRKVTSFSTSRTLTRTETHLTFNSKYSQKMWYASHVCCWKVLQNNQQHICINKSFHTQICICCSLHMKYMFATLFLNILYVVCNLIISTLGSSTVQNKDGKGKRSMHLKTEYMKFESGNCLNNLIFLKKLCVCACMCVCECMCVCGKSNRK